MIDEKKIEKAIEDYVRYSSIEDEYPGTDGNAFKEGAKWAINELFKNLWHPSSEEPKNLEYIVFTTTMFGEVYLFTKQVNNTQDWKTIVKTHGIE